MTLNVITSNKNLATSQRTVVRDDVQSAGGSLTYCYRPSPPPHALSVSALNYRFVFMFATDKQIGLLRRTGFIQRTERARSLLIAFVGIHFGQPASTNCDYYLPLRRSCLDRSAASRRHSSRAPRIDVRLISFAGYFITGCACGPSSGADRRRTRPFVLFCGETLYSSPPLRS